MKLNRLSAHQHILFALKSANSKMMKAMLKQADPRLIDTLAEISLNCLKGHVKITRKKRTLLEKYKRDLRCLSCSKRSIASKRKLLVQRGHGFLPILLGSILSGVASTLVDKYFNKKNE